MGWFPEAFAEKDNATGSGVAAAAATTTEEQASASAAAPVDKTAATDAAAVPAAAVLDAIGPVSIETGKVLFDWSNEDDTFKIEQGQAVEVWRTDVDGWSLGRVNNTPGYVWTSCFEMKQ